MFGDGGNQLLFAEAAVGQVERLVLLLAGAQQLARTDAELAQQALQLGSVQGSFQVADHGRSQAALFQEFQRTAGFRAARVVIKRQIGHVRVASCVRWRLFYPRDGLS